MKNYKLSRISESKIEQYMAKIAFEDIVDNLSSEEIKSLSSDESINIEVEIVEGFHVNFELFFEEMKPQEVSIDA